MHSGFRKHILVISALFMMCMMLAVNAQAVKSKKPVKKANPNVKITATQAEKIALKKFPGKVVEKTKLENEEGVWQYGVMVKSGKTLREVMVNAKTGKIDSVEVTTAATEKKEAAKEKAATKGKQPNKASGKKK